MMIAFCAHQSNAQAAPGVYADATHPAGPPDPTKLDSIWQVDPLTGSLSVTIPFTTTPAGGRGPKIPFTLHYNSASTVTLQSQGSYSVGIPGILSITTTTALNNIVQQFRWSPTPIGPTTGPVGPWTTSGPFLYSAVTTIPDQNYTETVGNINVNINAGSGCTIYGPYIYTDESGAAHDMNLEMTNIGSSNTNMAPPCSGQVSGGAFVPYGPTSATTDGSALATTWSQQIGDTTLNGFPPNILYPDGTQFYLGTTVTGRTLEDSNGNQATFVKSGNTWTATDSLGRAAFTTTIPVGYPGQIPPGNYNVTTSGESGNSESYSLLFQTTSLGTFNMPNPIGGTLATAGIRNLGFCLTSITCTTEFGIIQPTPGSTLPVLTQITLPDSTQYLFTYDTTYGTISKIEFPTGGYVRFVWGIRGDTGGYGAYWYISTLVVTEACTSTGSGSENCWQYNFPSYSTTSGLTSTVTAPDGSTTAYTGVPIFYTGPSLYQMAAAPSWKEASRLEYSSSRTLTKSVATTYASGYANGLPAQVATTLYDGPTPLQQYVQYAYDSYSNLVEKDESDFNACTGTPCPMPTTLPSFLRKTLTSYVYANNQAWVTAHIVNKPYQVLVTDGSGNPYSLTTFTYDQSGQIGSAPAGLSNYDYANFGSLSLPRGNLTTESKCISGISATITNGSFTASCGSSWNTSYYYDGTGQLTQKVEGANLPTAPNWPARTVYTWGEQNNGFLTQVQQPDGNTDLYTYWPYIGAMKTHTDWNGQITNYDYTDPLNRIRSVTLPSTMDGTTGNAGQGTTIYNYNDSAGDFWVQGKHTVDTAGTTTSVTKYYDGLGRLVSAVTAVPTTQCSTGNIQVQTTYDTMSRVSSTSNPYCSTSDLTYGITQFAYDALGRKIKTILPDIAVNPQSFSTITYAGNATLTTDPFNGTTTVQHIQQSDGLGRLTSVCEVSASSLSSVSGDTPSACGIGVVEIPATGYSTTYTYNPLGDMRSVNQHGLARTFTYDNLSRLLTALNPEVGTDTYTYSNSSVACSPSADVPCTRQDARGIVTSYAYDSMSRLTSKSYGTTLPDPTSCYLYNMAVGTDPNPKGQLTAEWQQPQSAGSCGSSIPSNAVTVRIRSNHDAMGRVGMDQQCLTAANCSPTTTTGNFVYTYNLLGNPVQSNNGIAPSSRVGAMQVASTSGNGTAITAPSITWKTTYDMADHINNVVVQDQPSTSVLPTSTYSFAPTPLLPTSYDPFGHMTAASLGIPNGSSTPVVTIARQYDNRGRITNETDGGGTIYSYQVPSGGYAPNGNILKHVDSVMGTWNFTYDAVDRLMSATAGAGAPSPFAGLFGCWSYDSYGNRTLEAFSTAAPASCGQGANAQYTVTTPTANNRVSGFQYDASGNVTYDGQNSYLYDAEGRLCAYAFPIAGGGTGYYQFLYDAEGARVAKGSLTSWPSSCQAPTAANGFALYSQYLLDLGGEPVTQLDGSGNANYSNVFVGGQALATYVFAGAQGLHFNLTDPLGTKRAQVSATGAVELNCLSLPYGNDIGNTGATDCVGSGADDNKMHFTGKIRDTNSGLDYFGARYYSSAMGRFMSPDWSAKVVPVPYAKLDNPQSLNLYAYVMNNPLVRIDPDGHGCNGWGCLDGQQQQTEAAKLLNMTEQQQGQVHQAANVVYHETGGLTTTNAPGAGSAQDLHNARVDEATVYYHHPKAFDLKHDLVPVTANDQKTASWKDGLSAATEAFGRPDIGQHAIMYDPGSNYPHTTWMKAAYGIPDHVYGAFLNVAGGGDVPKGAMVDVLIMNDLTYRERQDQCECSKPQF